MTHDSLSLDDLRDIAQPPPVPWWPPAAGWWFLFALLIITSATLLYRTWRSWRANGYRRAALREIRTASTEAQIADILKRTALCAYPRSQIASLTGSQWCAWLRDTGGQELSESLQRSLTSGVFRDESLTNTNELAVFADHWVKNHRSQLASSRRSRPDSPREPELTSC